MASLMIRVPANYSHNAKFNISNGPRYRVGTPNSFAAHRRTTVTCTTNTNGGHQNDQQTLNPSQRGQGEPDIVDVTQRIIDLHERVVCALNPIHRERRSLRETKEELNNLREDLRRAHEQVHLSENRLEHALSRLQDMEDMIRKSATSPDLQMLDQEEEAMAPVSRREAILRDAPTSGGIKVKPSAVPERRRKGGNLRNFWYPVEFSPSLTSDKLIPFELFEDPWVLFRGPDGTPGCVRDECAHRACPLSLGKNVDGRIQCAYHGWEFSINGKCTKTPSTTACETKIESLPCVERHGMIFVWTGEGPPPLEDDNFTCLAPPEGYQVHSEILLEVPVEHGLLMENLLDLAHAPFTHTSTFAKGWSIPSLVNFKSSKEASVNGKYPGHWEPYPIDMAFQPPCMVLSTIGVTSPGNIRRGTRASDCERHLHQLHVCLPAGSGRTRLLYRMSLDFAGFARYLPFIDRFWKSLANQVLSEDLVLVKGQQDRMKQGADVWANPVMYDKLGVRYRRWRNEVEKGKATLSADYTL